MSEYKSVIILGEKISVLEHVRTQLQEYSSTKYYFLFTEFLQLNEGLLNLANGNIKIGEAVFPVTIMLVTDVTQ